MPQSTYPLSVVVAVYLDENAYGQPPTVVETTEISHVFTATGCCPSSELQILALQQRLERLRWVLQNPAAHRVQAITGQSMHNHTDVYY